MHLTWQRESPARARLPAAQPPPPCATSPAGRWREARLQPPAVGGFPLVRSRCRVAGQGGEVEAPLSGALHLSQPSSPGPRAGKGKEEGEEGTKVADVPCQRLTARGRGWWVPCPNLLAPACFSAFVPKMAGLLGFVPERHRILMPYDPPVREGRLSRDKACFAMLPSRQHPCSARWCKRPMLPGRKVGPGCWWQLESHQQLLWT